jgi:hypothetical protein
LQVDEDQELSQPARVDLSQLLSAEYRITSITELSLTANRRKADMPKPRAWAAEAEPIGSSSSSKVGGADGADASSMPYPRWGGVLGVEKCSRSSSSSTSGPLPHPQQQQRRAPSAGEAYNIWIHPGDAGTVVELYPMEIRTWLIEVDW